MLPFQIAENRFTVSDHRSAFDISGAGVGPQNLQDLQDSANLSPHLLVAVLAGFREGVLDPRRGGLHQTGPVKIDGSSQGAVDVAQRPSPDEQRRFGQQSAGML